MIYAGTKDGQTYGFYLEQTDLQNAFELTDEEHMALMDGQAYGKVIAFHPETKPTLENPAEPTVDALAARARLKRDQLIDAVDWRIRRYENQSAAGTGTTDSAEAFVELLAYVQALRDIPEQPGFPADIVWPELPE